MKSARLAAGLLALLGLVLTVDPAVAAEPRRTVKPGTTKTGPRVPTDRIYKWVDENGVTHYGESIPPQYRAQGGAEMNKRAITVREIDPMATPAQRQAALEKQRLESEEKKRVAAQARRDRALLNTYTSPGEIEEARDRNLALPRQAISGLQPRVDQGRARLVELQGKADAIEKSGKPVPERLQDDIAEQQAELEGLGAEIARHEAHIERIRARYDADRARYVELTTVSTR